MYGKISDIVLCIQKDSRTEMHFSARLDVSFGINARGSKALLEEYHMSRKITLQGYALTAITAAQKHLLMLDSK